MKDLNEKELMEIDGGMNDRPFGTSYDGYPSGGEKPSNWLGEMFLIFGSDMIPWG